VTKHLAIAQSTQRQTFGCPACGPLRLEDLGWHNVEFQFDLTGQTLTLSRPHSALPRATTRRHHVAR
jgi:hypothetical protein